MPDDLSVPHQPLVDAGRYERLSQARERGLVVAAMDLPHWIVREGPDFILRVEMGAAEAVAQELAIFESERRAQGAPPELEVGVGEIETLSLYVAAWVVSAFWLAQNLLPEWWSERGTAVSRLIMRDGEWWRIFTALTLHGDAPHVVANLASGLLFAAFVLPHLGTGVTWLAIVLAGAGGNWLNALFYSRAGHASIGASTAVFGALGLLVAAEFVARLSSAHTRSRWQLVLPLGAGLALLAFLGTGDEQQQRTDYMAHLWGFVVGLVSGAVACGAGIKQRVSPLVQRLAAAAAPGVLLLAWWLALRR